MPLSTVSYQSLRGFLFACLRTVSKPGYGYGYAPLGFAGGLRLRLRLEVSNA